MNVSFPKLVTANARPLRYGENPQQRGVLVPIETDDPFALTRFEHRHGPELSYTNWLDADGALYGLCQIGETEPACVIVKHAIPCGAAVAINRPADEAFVQLLLAERRVIRGLLAPEVTEGALRRLARRDNLWVLVNPALAKPVRPAGWEWRSVRGALLAQEVYDGLLAPADVEVVSKRQPSEMEWRDLRMAWGLVVATRSNAIAIVRDRQLVGSGAGQQDRLRPSQIAVAKAGDRAIGAVAASDAFFPFAVGDAPDVLLSAGVRAIVQPAGSRSDADVIRLCDERGAALVFTKGKRGFRH